MNRSLLCSFALCVLFILLLASCKGEQPTVDMSQVSTVVASTETAMAVGGPSPTMEGLPTQITPGEGTATRLAQDNTPTPTQTNAPTATASPTSTPAGPTTTPDCQDKATFVSETVPDGTPFSPGQKFVKSWKIKNTGTCTWTTSYGIVFVDGDEMGEKGPVLLTSNVPPNETGTFEVTLTASDQNGEYRSNWKLRNGREEIFGMGQSGTQPVWAEIKVVETSAGLDLGTPDWIDTFEKDKGTFPLGEYNSVVYKIKDGYLVMETLELVGDQWRVASRPQIADFFIEAQFKMGKECSGKDSYGLILRAPGTDNSVIDSGLVYGFSCDGKFRIYRMDGGTYVGLQNWTSAPNLKSGTDQENKIGILAQGDTFKLYINGAMVSEIVDSTYDEGKFGLMIRSDETSNLIVSVNQIATWNVP
jgi:hypothetical protein